MMQFKQISNSSAVLFAQLYVISVKKLSSENIVCCLNGLKDVRAAHPYCASNSHAKSCIDTRALSNKMNNNKANGHCYSFARI